MDGVTATGISSSTSVSTSTLAAGDELRQKQVRKRESHHPKWLEELHEVAGNLVLVAVGCHVAYLLLWKRPLALFMLFLVKPRAPKKNPPAA